ncbi:DAK2 domain-containing protein [Nocardia sp. CDC159]|uniref:DAK2 domain-containing protein n=1 Tax=Nocardia pulmonis TaxID=2951408 RepID=A0A9X2IVE0_9NOCA|nr:MULTISPECIES: DAK2 domain-containing protein [Nocardia]MCM6773797.1 DAK2 domain-containing protein [Nocardia pulmonis]MCM6786684.1 DAK2 domain-containing protein [Nocardia sp. CDC159]
MPGVRETLDGAALARWGQLCLDGLERHRDEINALNVFPVADSDTGTNLLATMRAAVAAVPETASAHSVLGAMARAGTGGARGNSGIILSQVLRGLAEAVDGAELSAPSLPVALRGAAVLVREALSEPVEGTMLTVLEAAADRVADTAGEPLADIARAAAEGAAKALADTPSQLGVLRAAGVVDAGARGLLVLFDALVEVITGSAPVRPGYVRGAAGVRTASADTAPAPGPSPVSASSLVPAVVGTPHYEVMYLLSGTDESRIAGLRNDLARLGDSVVVVGDGEGVFSAHVHCADAGAAIEAGLAAGTLGSIRIEGLAVNPLAAQGSSDRGILAVVAGAGAARLFEDAGAVVLDGRVTAEVLLDAIRRMPHREVLVLPNGALPAHELVAVSVAARDGHREVLMLPSGSMVQGLAALALHDDGRIAVDDAFTMSEAAAGTRWGALRIAPERALTIVGTCERGDGLGLVGHDVVVIDPDPGRAARTLLDRMLGLGGELVTLLLGAQAPPGLGDELAEHISATFPGVEVVSYDGGQPVDLVQIGVE